MVLQPYFHTDSHPAFRNSQILTRKQQLNNDPAEYCAQQERENEKIVLDYIPVLTKLYNHNKVPFQYLSKGFDNVCYNLMIPLGKHYSYRLFQYLKEQNAIIEKVSFLNYATENLLNTLYNLSYKTLWKEYQEFVLTLPDENNEMTENEVNQLFISEFQNQEKIQVFFSKYPILAKLLCDSAEIWLNKHQLIFAFLTQDIFSVRNYFGLSIDIEKPVEIQNLTISGDNHDKNNFVAIIEFAENQKIVLKNRIAKPEMVLSKSIDFFADKNINLKSPKILETNEHYWTEFIEYKPCNDEKELADYYTRIGNLTALLYALNAVDIHYENVIANGAYPVIIDAECLFYTNFDSGYCNNVLDISLLPSDHQIGPQEIWLGGTDKAGEQNALFSNLTVDENYQLKEEKGNFKNAQNIPFLQSGKSVNIFDYQNNIECGFCEVYDLLVRYKKEFTSLIQSEFPLKVRYLNRSTYSYSHLLRQSLFPKYLTGSLSYNWVFEWLWHNAEANSKYNVFIPYEQEMLKQRFVPFFCYNTNSSDLLTSSNETVQKDFFVRSAEELFLEKMNFLSKDDKQIQLRIIEMQFLKLANNRTEHFTSKDFCKQVIKKIKDCILPINNTIEAFDFIGGNVKKVDINLYDGYAGYLLFLIYYRKIYQDYSINDLISIIYEKIVIEIENQEKNFEIGAFLGIASCLYVFTHLFALEQNEIYLREIEKIENLVLEKVNQNTVSSNDIVGGIAGSIVCLHGFYKLCKKKNNKKLIIRLAEILVENAEQINENRVGWISKRGVPLVGYSHGNAGIGQALLIAYELSNNNVFLVCFEKCLNFESKNFDKEKEVWADQRKELYENENTSWCNGMTGIGLARMNYLKQNNLSVDNERIKKDVVFSVKACLKWGISDIDVLCHGNWGSIELLLYYNQNIEKREDILDYLEKIKNFLLQKMDDNKIKCNNKNNMLSISFMTGLSGIAFEMLRLENPGVVPSVLLLERPKVIL
jgi:type 2 lantibiotic biosynthesis protein LanM